MTDISIEPPSVATLFDHEFDTSNRLGCSHLCKVKKSQSGEESVGKIFTSETLPTFLQQEGAVYKCLRTHPHANILPPTSVLQGPDNCAILFPDLDTDIHTFAKEKKGLPEREAKAIFRSIVSAVRHCHSHRIVLRDLRLGKIFFRKSPSGEQTRDVVLADLDGAQIVPRTAPFLFDRKGSPAFVSPEVVIAPLYDGAAVDMWALGVCLYILLTGNFPFQDSHPASLFHKIQQGHTAVHFPPSMSEAARDILRKLLVREPHLRLTADQLLQDLWFSAPSFAPVIPKAEEHAAVALAELWKKRVLCEGETGSQKRSRESYGEIEVSEGLYSDA